MKLLSFPDLCKRWNYTKAGIYKLSKRPDFPKPFATVSQGRTKIFLESDIIQYEKNREWLFDEFQKIQRQKLFYILQQVKEEIDPEKKKATLEYLFGKERKD